MALDNTTMEKRSKKRKQRSESSTAEATAPEDTPSFASFRLDARLLKAVTNHFEKPTLVQAAAIPLTLNGRDIVARAKTGSGKTAAYVIPVIHQILTKPVCLLSITDCRMSRVRVRSHWS
jgi:ATP-dependent RNA helicase DDX56/DBP9